MRSLRGLDPRHPVRRPREPRSSTPSPLPADVEEASPPYTVCTVGSGTHRSPPAEGGGHESRLGSDLRGARRQRGDSRALPRGHLGALGVQQLIQLVRIARGGSFQRWSRREATDRGGRSRVVRRPARRGVLLEGRKDRGLERPRPSELSRSSRQEVGTKSSSPCPRRRSPSTGSCWTSRPNGRSRERWCGSSTLQRPSSRSPPDRMGVSPSSFPRGKRICSCGSSGTDTAKRRPTRVPPTAIPTIHRSSTSVVRPPWSPRSSTPRTGSGRLLSRWCSRSVITSSRKEAAESEVSQASTTPPIGRASRPGGVAELNGLPPGVSMTLDVYRGSKPCYRYGRIELKPGEERHETLVIGSGAIVSGRILEADRTDPRPTKLWMLPADSPLTPAASPDSGTDRSAADLHGARGRRNDDLRFDRGVFVRRRTERPMDHRYRPYEE